MERTRTAAGGAGGSSLALCLFCCKTASLAVGAPARTDVSWNVNAKIVIACKSEGLIVENQENQSFEQRISKRGTPFDERL